MSRIKLRIRVRCVQCRATALIDPKTVDPELGPFCEKCGSPMLANRAEIREEP